MKTAGRARRLGVLVAIVATAAYALLVPVAVAGDNRIDSRVARASLTHKRPWATHIFRAWSHLGDTPFVIGAVVAAVLVLIASRRFALGALVAVAVGASAVLTLFFKWSVGRPRPNSRDWLVGARGTAFPSGHAAKAAALYCALAIVVTTLAGRRWLAKVTWVMALAAVAGVGVSRVYLEVHWASDVVAGWLLGVAVVAGTWLVLDVIATAHRGPPTTVALDAAVAPGA